MSFELTDTQPGVKVVGVNISHNQLISAENYRRRISRNSILFSNQDYHHLAFPNGIFNVVIFCESYIHSYDKRQLAQEAYRVLKPNGEIVVSDTFLERNPEDEEKKTALLHLKNGWYLPSILRTEELRTIWEDMGFHDIYFGKHTSNIINSSRRMRKHAELRISQGNAGSEVLRLSRKATIACNEAFENGLTGYYFARGCTSLMNSITISSKIVLSDTIPGMLPEPWANITVDFEAIIQAFQDVRYIGELRQKWGEIQKIHFHNKSKFMLSI